MMAPVPRRGEIWLADLPGDKVRPILVLRRDGVIQYLHSVIAAPITSRIRDIRSELRVSVEEGLRVTSVVNFDSLQLVSRSPLDRQARRCLPGAPPRRRLLITSRAGWARACRVGAIPAPAAK